MSLRFFALFFILSIPLSAQRLQGALKVGYGYTLLKETGSHYNAAEFRVTGMRMPSFGVQLNYKLDSTWELSSGIGMVYRKILFEQHNITFPLISTGSLYIRARFSSVDVPLLLRYNIGIGSKFKLIPSAGFVMSAFRINATAVGYKDLRYEGTDSLFYDVKGGGSFVRRFSADPYVSLSVEKEQDGLKVFGLALSFQYTPVKIPSIEFTSTLGNSAETRTYTGLLNGNLCYAALSVMYYPSFLSFRKSDVEDDAYEIEE